MRVVGPIGRTSPPSHARNSVSSDAVPPLLVAIEAEALGKLGIARLDFVRQLVRLAQTRTLRREKPR